MATATKSMPLWPGLDKSQKVRVMMDSARMGSKKMVTVKAARIIGERYERKALKR